MTHCVRCVIDHVRLEAVPGVPDGVQAVDVACPFAAHGLTENEVRANAELAGQLDEALAERKEHARLAEPCEVSDFCDCGDGESFAYLNRPPITSIMDVRVIEWAVDRGGETVRKRVADQAAEIADLRTRLMDARKGEHALRQQLEEARRGK